MHGIGIIVGLLLAVIVFGACVIFAVVYYATYAVLWTVAGIAWGIRKLRERRR